jgi:ATP-dependent Clp protease ATP-binding subunit ClpC
MESLRFYSELKKSKILEKIRAQKNLLFRFVKIEKKIFLFLTLIFLFLSFKFSKFLGFFFIFLSLFWFSLWREIFLETKLKTLPEKKEKLVDFLSFEVAQALYSAFKFAKNKKIPQVNSSLFLYFLLKEKEPKLNFVFLRLLIDRNELRERLLKDETKEEIFEILTEIGEKVVEKGKTKIEGIDVISFLVEKNKVLNDFLIEKNLKAEEVKKVIEWAQILEEEFLETKKWYKYENLLRLGTIGREWATAYTPLLDRFSIDYLTFVKKEKFKKIFVHQEKLKEVERILCQPEKNDVLIVGKAGSARRSIVFALARDLALGKGPKEINFKRVVLFDLQNLFLSCQTQETLEIYLNQIFAEAIRGEVILVIDDLHKFVGTKKEKEVGVMDISSVLSSFLPLPQFKMIGITTPEGLHKSIETVPGFLENFEIVEIPEVSKEEALQILEDRALRLEQKYKVFFSFQSLFEIVELCEKYIPQEPFPEKAIEILDALATKISKRSQKIVFPEDVAKLITEKTKIPVGEIEKTEREKLLKLEELLHQRIINQDMAVKEISEALRRARAEIKTRKGPIGSFLFLGPTGVGKTETAKALSEIYFGSEKEMIRLDMSEFQNLEDIERLIGKEGQEGLLTTPVLEKPFSLILLDEFEKAHPNILNLFLQVFDEGHLTDGRGKKVIFKNTLIIATSNAGAELIFKAVEMKKDWQKMKEELINYLVENRIFKPELLNRFDGIILFSPLSKENLMDIAELLLKKIQKSLREKGIEFLISEKLKEKIVELSYNPRFGAREMQRVIDNKVGNVLAKALLEDKIKRGEKITINPENFEIEKL